MCSVILVPVPKTIPRIPLKPLRAASFSRVDPEVFAAPFPAAGSGAQNQVAIFDDNASIEPIVTAIDTLVIDSLVATEESP